MVARRLQAAEVESGDAVMAERMQADERKAAARARRAEDAQRILHRLYEGGPDRSYAEAVGPSAAR